MFLIYMLVLFVVTDGAEIGEHCSVNNRQGICTELNKCRNVLESGDKLSCRSSGSSDIVCCDEADILLQEDQCGPIPALTTNKTGKKAWDKCVDYQKLVFPCQNNVRANLCPYSNADQLILNYNNYVPKTNEFPHNVLLGYANENKEMQWLCDGTLVSERFVLTSAGCVTNIWSDRIKHVALNPSDRARVDGDTVYGIKSIIRHPQFRKPMNYYNIALLELEDLVPLSHTVVPACLVGADPEELDATAIYWSSTYDKQETGYNYLSKLHVTKYTAAECSYLYPKRKGIYAYNDTTQICYGEKTTTSGFCRSYAGAPLVVRHKSLSCIYSIVGVASHGKACRTHTPGVYFRVEPILDWIESVVWP